jgi:hypothetical protein
LPQGALDAEALTDLELAPSRCRMWVTRAGSLGGLAGENERGGMPGKAKTVTNLKAWAGEEANSRCVALHYCIPLLAHSKRGLA